jgi:hypothetical protein
MVDTVWQNVEMTGENQKAPKRLTETTLGGAQRNSPEAGNINSSG